jgi:hypothetical protein
MFEEVACPPTIGKASAERNDKGQFGPDVFGSPSSARTPGEPPGIPSGSEDRPLPVLVSSPTPRRRRAPARPALGIILYLASIMLVATATIGVFFGVGFFLLAGFAEGMVPSSGGAHTAEFSPPVFGVLSRLFSKPSPPENDLAPAPIEAETAGSAAVAALPPAPLSQPSVRDQRAMPDKSDAVPPSVAGDRSAGVPQDAPNGGKRPGSEFTEPAAVAPAPKAGSPEPAPTPPVVEAAPVPPPLTLSAAELGELLTRGDAFLRMGDLTSARLFYERAATAGNGQGAMRMGATFDPSFLGRAGFGSAWGDPLKAQFWYDRATDLSTGEVQHQSSALEIR